MHNHLSMSAEFERQKNLQASVYTAAITIGLLLVLIWVKMTIPHQDTPVVEEFVDINLGNGDEGMGTDQPQLPGEPAPAQQVAYTPPQPRASSEESVRDVAENSDDRDDPPVVKPTVSKPDAPRINAESRTVRTPTTSPQPVATPTPPRPKAVLGRTVGGTGNGGNGADSYKPGGNEGIAGGNGDQGRVGGDPNGRNYSGTPRNLGTRIVSIPSQNFEDDFNEAGTVVLDISVDENGRLISAVYQQAGSTITNRNQIEIAKRRAAQIKYPQYEGGFKQRIKMNFQVRS